MLTTLYYYHCTMFNLKLYIMTNSEIQTSLKRFNSNPNHLAFYSSPLNYAYIDGIVYSFENWIKDGKYNVPEVLEEECDVNSVSDFVRFIASHI